MRREFLGVITCAALLGSTQAYAAPTVLYDNLTPNDSLAMASRPGTTSFEIETADDFVLGAPASLSSATFDGLIVPGASGIPSVLQVAVEIYRVFPLDSNVARTSGPATFSTSSVPTRVNSPSDIAFDSRDSAAAQLAFSASVLAQSFTALNSIQPGGIHPTPNQTTLGNGPVTGQEVQFTATFATPLSLPADHYYFVPQVALSNGGTFYWLSASRPISGAGTTQIAPDLQVWTRDANLEPDWLRAGTDIVGGGTTFNAAFALNGVAAVPEPSSWLMLGIGLGGLGFMRRRRT